MSLVFRALFNALAQGGARSRLSTLIFHRVLPQPDPLFPDEITRERFDELCGWLKAWFQVLPLSDAAALLRQGTLPRGALSITFDDGYADNHDVALPVLQRHGLNATFFVATGFLDGGRMWNDTLIEAVRASRLSTLDLRGLHPQVSALPMENVQAKTLAIGRLVKYAKYMPVEERIQFVDAVAQRAEASLPGNLMMSTPQVRQLRAAGMHIGAHTVTHPILRSLPRPAARHEIEASKQHLERLLGEPVSLFAYPNGKFGEDYSPESVELAREAGFAAAVSTQWGVSTQRTDPFQLRRFTPWDRQGWRFGLRMAGNLARYSDS